jgi:hypothetical protein
MSREDRRNAMFRPEAERMARNLDGVLRRVEEHWVAQGVPIARHLAPGLSDGEIDELLMPAGLELNEVNRALFRWHDGATANGADLGEESRDAAVMGWMQFRPLHDAISFWQGPWRDESRRFASRVSDEYGPDGPWATRWFPLFQEVGGRGAIVTRTEPARWGRPYTIRRAHLPEPPTEWPEKTSLLIWFTFLLVWLDNGYMRWNPVTTDWDYDESIDLMTYHATWWW